MEVHQIFPVATNPLQTFRSKPARSLLSPTPHAISHCPRAGGLSLAGVQLKTMGWVFTVRPWAWRCEAGGDGDTEEENI